MKNKKGVIFLVFGSLLILVSGMLCAFNIAEDNRAGKQSAQIVKQLQTEQTNSGDEIIVEDVGTFCGRIIIEKIDIELPVFKDWNYTKLKTAPCRYTGSIENSDMIIAAHNYKSHFGKLNQLNSGDTVVFVDANGTEHKYTVEQITELDGTNVEDMKSGDYGLTLFTCTKGGKQRVTVRCNKSADTF